MVRKDLRNMTQTKIVFSWEAGGIFHSQTLGYFNLSLQGGRKHHWNCFNLHFNFHDCNLQHLIRTYCIKYQNDIRWVSQNTTLYSVRCQKIDNMFRPFSIRPSSGLTWWPKEDLTELNTLSGIEGYTMDTQPSAPGPQQRYRYGYIRDIPHHPPHSHTFCT